MWFLFALICILGWGFADLFYKKSSEQNDNLSHLKIAVWVGIVMGVCAIALFPFAETKMSFSVLIENSVKYLPASLSYIISMVIGYAGLRYLELSIVSPIQNASGALSAICMIVFFLIKDSISNIWEEFSTIDFIGTLLIVVGVILLAIIEQRLSYKEEGKIEKKYKFGALALLFPIFYCVFDTVGTAVDGIILDSDAGLGLGEIDVIILYGLTFMFAGIIVWFYMLIFKKQAYNPFKKSERPKLIAACSEEFGQVFYVYAMASKPVLAAPMVASYCIISIILSRFILKEKLKKSQALSIIFVCLGIVLLGISEGLAEK